MIAASPADWVRWLAGACAPAGLNHGLISFTDPFTLKAWVGQPRGARPPGLVDQIRLFGEQVLPEPA